MKIAFVVDRFGNRWGGAEAYGVELMRELAQEHDITVFARDYDPECELKLNYVPLNTRPYWPSWLRVYLHARQVARQTQDEFDIVHSHSNGWAGDIEVIHVTPVRYNWRVRSLSFFKRITSYISVRVAVYLHLEKRRVRTCARRQVVAVSPLIAKQLVQAYPFLKSIPVIAPAVHLPCASTHQERQRLRQSLGYSENDFIGLMVARNPLRKGLQTVMQAYAKLDDKHKLLIVGSDRQTEAAIKKLPEYSLLKYRIVLIEATPQVQPYYSIANVFLHPTRNDSFGMAPLEAMSHAIPVVLSPAPWCGFASYLKHKHNVLLLDDPYQVSQMKQYVLELEKNRALYQVLSQEGLNIAKQHSWSHVASRYLALYKQVLDARSSHVANTPAGPHIL